MSPRRSVAEARRTRRRIVERSADVASAEGLEGLTVGRLATDLEMSKSGVLGHFGSKEALQLAAVELAAEEFRAEMTERLGALEPGRERLLAVLDAWVANIAGGRFAGGCFWASASAELDAREGPVRDAVRLTIGQWQDFLRGELEALKERGELDAGADVEQIVFELAGVGLGLNQQLQMLDDGRAAQRARRAVRRILATA